MSTENQGEERQEQEFKEITLEEYGKKLEDLEESFFTYEGKITVYFGSSGEKYPTFSFPKKRLTCIEKILSFIAKDLSDSLLTKIETNENAEPITVLEFEGDEEVLQTMKTRKVHYKIKKDISQYINELNGKTQSASQRENEMIIESLNQIKGKKLLKEGSYPILILVRRKASKEFLYMNLVKINPLNFYLNSKSPYLVTLGKTQFWINLSPYQKELHDSGKLSYYRTENELEPTLVPKEKEVFINSILATIGETSLIPEPEEGKVLSFRFKDGFRDMISLYGGHKTLTTKIANEDLKSFEKEQYYQTILLDIMKGKKVAIFFIYIPNTDRLIDITYIPF